MREILFRGKCDGDWIYGSLVYSHKEDAYYIVEHNEDELSFRVETQTVGQFTGLTDKNGKRIFEGDIVKFFDMVGKVCFEQGCFGIGTSNLIEWEKLEEEILPITSCDNEPQFLYNDFFISFWELLWNYNAEDNCNVCEVIGNIHDNPELLEEKYVDLL